MHCIVIEYYPDKFVFRNPGTLLVSVEQYFEGGTSICRNYTENYNSRSSELPVPVQSA